MYYRSKLIKITFLLLCSFIMIFPVIGQQVSLRGIVVDAETGEGLAHANLVLVRQSKVAVGNSQGAFSFMLPSDVRATDTLRVSFMGYESGVYQVGDLKKDSNLQIRLQKTEKVLDAAVVLGYPVKDLMKKFLENMSNTFYPDPLEFDVFYQEVIEEDGRYVGFARAAGYMHYAGYDPSFFEKNKNSGDGDVHYNTFYQVQKSDYHVLHSFSGSGRNAVNWWIASEPFLYFGLNPNWFEYTLEGEDIIHDRPVYVLSFRAASKAFERDIKKWGRSHKKKLQQGKFYIDQLDYGLHRMSLKWENPDQETKMSESRRYKYLPIDESMNAYFRRDEDGRYLFSYVNYSASAIGYGYEGEGFHEGKLMKEFAELYAIESYPVALSYDEIRSRYSYGLRGKAPYYILNYVPDLYNGWIFLPGRSTYDPKFWENASFPPLPNEQKVLTDLSQHRPLSEQFADYSNIQLYIIPELKRRHKISNPYWNRKEIQIY